jgi:hypothetical protein
MRVADIEARLEEWRRWCLLCGRRCGQAGSAEGNYRSPQHWDPVTWAPQMRPIAHRAYQVELAVVALPDPFRSVLVLHYVRQTPDVVLHHIARRRWRISDTLPVLQEARGRVGAALSRDAPSAAQAS